MIFTESTIKISNNVSKMDSTIVLYRGDKNVEIRFTILQSPFKYSNTVATNVIESTNASYGQLVIKTPNDKPPIFSEVSATKEGTVLFTITKEMIDEIEELGVYTFQIRLMDENKQSRVTIPPVENGIEIKEPIAIEDDNTTNVVGLAKANYAVTTLSDVDTPAFDDAGKYNKTNWNDGDIITSASLNKIEDGIYTTNENVTATKKYVDDNTVIYPLPVHTIQETTAIVIKVVNIMDLIDGVTYSTHKDLNETRRQSYRVAYVCDDGSFKVICTLSLTNKIVHLVKVIHFAQNNYSVLSDNNTVYTVDYSKHSTNTDIQITKTLQNYLPINNTTEYNPTKEYHPATKKYVDDNRIAYTISSKVLATVPASNIKIDNSITVSNASINGDRRYYMEFLGSKKLCSLLLDDKVGNTIICNINNYKIEAFEDSTNITISISKINDTINDETFTDLVIHEEEIKYLDSKYIENDLILQNSISLGRVGDIGVSSSAIGYGVRASGDFSHAEGSGTTASGMSSHAEGNDASASGNYSHAEGDSSTASGYASHAEGSTTTASGVNSHAEGDYTTASGASSHAEGYGSKASSQFQHVQGKYNIEDKDRKYAHIVGNGAGDAKRSNAHTLDWKGNGWYAGKLSQEGTPIEDKDLVTKKYVDDKIKTDLGTSELTTTAKDIKGAVNELNTQYKDIEKKIYYVTPQYFGAKADGVTDDTTFIKTAITYCINNSVVLKMHGTYKTSETLVFTGEFKLIAKNVKIIYSGADYAIRITNSTNADIEIDEIHSMNGGCIEIYSSSNENYVQYLTLKGKELQSKNKCIFFNVTGGWANQNTIENFKLQSGEYGVYADAKDVDCINGISFYNVGVEGVNTGFYIANSAQCWSLINIRHLESYKTFIETVGKVTINIVGYSYFYFGRDAEVKLSNKTSGSIISPIIKDDGVILDYYAEIVDGTVIPNNYRAYLNIYDHANTVLTKEQFYNYFLANNVSSSLELSKAYGCYNGINEFIIKCDFDNGTNFIVYDYNKNIIFNNTVDTGWSSLKFQWFAEVGWKIEKISYITNLKASS